MGNHSSKSMGYDELKTYQTHHNRLGGRIGMATETRRFSGIIERAEPSEDEVQLVRQAVDARIGQLLPESEQGDALTGAMRAAALGSGKRMRPLLLMLVARDVACAVELVHASSLVLDDMPCMDNARLRRGRPAVHVQFGEDVAILASIALLSRAFCILSAAQDIAPAVRSRLVCTLAETVGAQGLARGQFQDLHGGGKRSAADIATTNELKTGVLLGVTVEMAAIVAQADDQVAGSLRAFALAAGHAFQIRDDFADGSDSAITGKDTGKDAGKATFISTLGSAEAARRLAGYLQEAERHLHDAVGARSRTRRFVERLFPQAAPEARFVGGIVARPAARLDARIG